MKSDQELVKPSVYLGKVLLAKYKEVEEFERSKEKFPKYFKNAAYKKAKEAYLRLLDQTLLPYVSSYDENEVRIFQENKGKFRPFSEIHNDSLYEKRNKSLLGDALEHAYESFIRLLKSKIELMNLLSEHKGVVNEASSQLIKAIDELEKPAVNISMDTLEPLSIEAYRVFFAQERDYSLGNRLSLQRSSGNRKGMHWAFALLVTAATMYILNFLWLPITSNLVINAVNYSQSLMVFTVIMIVNVLYAFLGVVLWTKLTINRYCESIVWLRYTYAVAILRGIFLWTEIYLGTEIESIYPAFLLIIVSACVLASFGSFLYVKRAIKEKRPKRQLRV